MLLSYLRRALLPNPNRIGFGPTDFLELALAALLVLAALFWRPWIEPRISRLAERTRLSMLLLAILPVALRLLLLAHDPVPIPDLSSEFSRLLAADTLRHFRLANAPHALPQFFETLSVLQQPTYSSACPIGQGFALSIGWMIFGVPWAGVLLAVAAFCSLCYWMLRGWTTPGWALVGGSLAVIQFGPLNQWTNSYSGGAPAAAAGCLVFGALPRLRETPRPRYALLLGTGLGLLLLIRPYESIFLFLAVLLYLLWAKPADCLHSVGLALLALFPALLLIPLHNHAVTGSWTTSPETLGRYQYGLPVSLTFQAEPVPHRPLTPQQALDYKMQLSFRSAHETITTYFQRLEYRIRFYRFFLLPPLYLAALAFLWSLGQFRFAWVALTLALFALGTNFIPAFDYQYLAGVTGLFILVAVTGLELIARISVRGHPAGWEAAGLIVLVCYFQFLFWYGARAVDQRIPESRIFVARQLAAVPGKLLVFVRYQPQHPFLEEWVYNAADIDASRIVWARDLGSAENQQLLRYYTDRTVLLLEPDSRPPRLAAYESKPQP